MTKPEFDGDNRVIIPADLIETTSSKMTCAKLWLRLAELSKPGENTLTFESMDDLAAAIRYPKAASIFRVLSSLERYGWITRTRGLNANYRRFEITLQGEQLPPGERSTLPTRPRKL